MYTSPRDFAEVRARWYRTQKQREAYYAVAICGGLYLLIVIGVIVADLIRGR